MAAHTVALATDGLDSLGAEFAPQPADLDIDNIGIRLLVAVIDMFGQLGAGHDSGRGVNQMR